MVPLFRHKINWENCHIEERNLETIKESGNREVPIKRSIPSTPRHRRTRCQFRRSDRLPLHPWSFSLVSHPILDFARFNLMVFSGFIVRFLVLIWLFSVVPIVCLWNFMYWACSDRRCSCFWCCLMHAWWLCGQCGCCYGVWGCERGVLELYGSGCWFFE